MRTTYGTILLAALLAGFGCDGGTVTPDGSTPLDSGDDQDAGGGQEDAGMDAGPEGDGNDEFSSATEIDINSNGTGVIDPAGDLDYYAFEGTEGQWIQILAEVEEAPTRADPVITLYDSAMNQMAESDDLVPREQGPGNLRSQIITRLPATGTYYVLVQEWSTWSPESEGTVGGPQYDYELTVGEIVVSETVPAVNIDAEENDDAATAQPLTEAAEGTSGSSIILGTFEDATDVDVYSFTIEGAAQYVGVNLMQDGTTGNTGAAGRPAHIWVANESGTEIIARIDPSIFEVDVLENVMMTPSLQPGDYRLFVEGNAADFYVIKMAHAVGDNPPEEDDVANDDPAGAQVIDLAPNATFPNTRSGYVLASLPEGDTDFFSITTEEGEAVSVSCGSLSLGSGVTGLRIALVDADTPTTEIAFDVETPTEGAQIESAEVEGAGTYLVQLTRGAQATGVTGTYVRCGFHLAPPPPAP